MAGGGGHYLKRSRLEDTPMCSITDAEEEEEKEIFEEDQHARNKLEDETFSPCIVKRYRDTSSNASFMAGPFYGDQSEITTTASQDKVPKGPFYGDQNDITSTSMESAKAMQCPGCNSTDTEFFLCNNQSRQFCKNCQRDSSVSASLHMAQSSSSSSIWFDVNVADDKSITYLGFGTNNQPTHIFKEKAIPINSRNGEKISHEENHHSRTPPILSITGNEGGLSRLETLPDSSTHDEHPSDDTPGFPHFFHSAPAYCLLASTPSPLYVSSANTSLSLPSLREGKVLSAGVSQGTGDPSDIENSNSNQKVRRISEKSRRSMWTTLGKTLGNDCVTAREVCNRLEINSSEATPTSNTSLALQANPAAWLRSQNFRENL